MTKKKTSALDALGGGEIVRAMIKEIVAEEVTPLAEELTAARGVVAAAREVYEHCAIRDEDGLVDDLESELMNYDLVVQACHKPKISC